MQDNKQADASGWTVPSLTQVFLVTVPAIVTFMLFFLLGHGGEGKVAAVFVYIIIFITLWRPDLQKRGWFWTMLALFALAHGLLVFLVPWPKSPYPGVLLVPFAILDLAIYYSTISLLEKKFHSRE